MRDLRLSTMISLIEASDVSFVMEMISFLLDGESAIGMKKPLGERRSIGA